MVLVLIVIVVVVFVLLCWIVGVIKWKCGDEKIEVRLDGELRNNEYYVYFSERYIYLFIVVYEYLGLLYYRVLVNE